VPLQPVRRSRLSSRASDLLAASKADATIRSTKPTPCCSTYATASSAVRLSLSMHRSDELWPGLTDQGRIAGIRQKRYHPTDPWGQRRPRRRTAQGGHLRAPLGALFISGSRAGYRLRCGVDSGPMQLRPILPPRAGPSSAPSWGAFSLPAPVLEPIRTSLRSVAPGQGEPLLDQNLSEIPATHVDAGEGTPVAVLAMSLNL
jgi:hypothetical protein